VNRRDFIIALSGAAVATPLPWPRAGRAQQPERIRRIGVLMGFEATNSEAQSFAKAFSQQLQERGWIDGKNARFEYRWASGSFERFKSYAAELVALKPDVILANTTPAVAALQQQTATIPLVFVQVTDPLGQGFIASLSHPGGNLTGFSFVDFTVSGKWLEALKEIAPAVNRVAVIYSQKTMPFAPYLPSLQSAATSLGLEMIAAPVQDNDEIERSVAAISREAGGGLCVIPDPFVAEHAVKIVELAARYRIPAIYPRRGFVVDGGLIAYGTDVVDLFKGAAGYVDRILRGEKPADLPVQSPTKYELIINLKTARNLGITVPPSLIARADEVIE
jgi:putative tryptophan/tyrosine transport system substrate-binding protein